MAKLTLSVDETVVRRAKQYAERHRTSVSRLVEQYLRLLVRPREEEDTPVLRQLRGILRTGDREEYRRYLVEKHR